MANIEFKGFKLIYANGWDIQTVLASAATTPDTLYLVRTNENGNDGYLVLNKKVYGSAEEAKALIAGMNANISIKDNEFVKGEIVETNGKITKFTIDETSLKNKFTEINNAITAITSTNGTIDTKINTAIEGLDATIKTESGCTLPITIVQENGKLTSVEITTVELNNAINDIGIIKTDFKTFTANTANDFSAVNQRINNLDATVSGTSTNSPITVKVEQVDGKLTGVTVTDTLGTASKADVNTVGLSIPGNNEDNSGKTGLTTAAQVENFVKASVADLTGAMHFKGIVPTEGDLPAVTDYKAGDVILKGTKEYVLNETGGVKSWVELGDEGLYVTKSTTIAGLALQNNISKTDLLNALNVADGAQVNVLEGVQVNGTPLTIDSGKTVDITVASGTDNGTIKVNGTNVAVHGLGSAAYTNSDAYDPKDTAKTEIAKISGSTSGESTNKYVTVTTDQVAGKVTGITVNDAELKTTIDNLSNAAVKNVNGQTGNTITLTGANIAVGADVDGDGTMTANNKVSEVLADIYTKLNTTNANAYTGITAANKTVTVTETTHGHSVAVNLKTLSEPEKASGLIQLVSAEDGSGIYGKLFYDGTETVLGLPK